MLCVAVLKVNDVISGDKSATTYEHAIGHLERALSLFEKFMELYNQESVFLSAAGEEPKKSWFPDIPSSHPSHLRALLRGR
jgi:hypothetical protein